MEETLKALPSLRQGAVDQLHDVVFLNEIRKYVRLAEQAYEKYNFRDAQKYGFFEMQKARDKYRKICELTKSPAHRDLMVYFIEVRRSRVQKWMGFWSQPSKYDTCIDFIAFPFCWLFADANYCASAYLSAHLRALVGFAGQQKQHIQSQLAAGGGGFARVCGCRRISSQCRNYAAQVARPATHQEADQALSVSGQRSTEESWVKVGSEALVTSNSPCTGLDLPCARSLYVARDYPPWQATVLKYLAAHRSADNKFPPMNEIHGVRWVVLLAEVTEKKY